MWFVEIFSPTVVSIRLGISLSPRVSLPFSIISFIRHETVFNNMRILMRNSVEMLRHGDGLNI